MIRRTVWLLSVLMVLCAANCAWADAASEARALYKQGQYAGALEKFRQALHEHPDDPTLYWQLGFTYRKLQRYEEALTAFEKAGKIDPTHSFASQPGKYEEVIASTRRKIRAKPRRPVPRAVAASAPLGRLPEVIALKNGSVYVDDARRREVDADRLQSVALELRSKGIVKFIVLAKEYRRGQLARYAATIHRALGLGKGYLLVASRGGVVGVSESASAEQLRAACSRVAGRIRRGDVTGGLEKLARSLVEK